MSCHVMSCHVILSHVIYFNVMGQAKYDLVANIVHDSSHVQELTVGIGSQLGASSAAAPLYPLSPPFPL